MSKLTVCRSNLSRNSGTFPDAILVNVTPSSFDPDSTKFAGSRSGASLADVSAKPVTTPSVVVMVKPVFTLSKFRYFVFGLLSIAFSTVSLEGERWEVGIIRSLEWVTSANVESFTR